MIEPDQALKFAESVLRGQPDREAIIANALRTKVRELI